jgi:hypothetical protein
VYQRKMREAGLSRPWLGPLSVVVASVLIGACGVSPSAGPAPSSPAPTVQAACAIVTAADISSAFNRQCPVGIAQSAPGGTNDECLFTGKDGIVAIEIAGGDRASQLYARAQQQVAGMSPRAGVGDEALLAADGTALVAIKGHVGVFITALLSGETAAALSAGCVLLVNVAFSRSGA